MPDPHMSLDEMRALMQRHAEAEFAQDVQATMATVGDNPEWEIMGLRMEGRDAVSEFYSRALGTMFARVKNVEQRAEWIGEDNIVVELWIDVEVPDGAVKRFGAMAVATFADGAMVGEHMYVDPELAELHLKVDLGIDGYSLHAETPHL